MKEILVEGKTKTLGKGQEQFCGYSCDILHFLCEDLDLSVLMNHAYF